MTKNLSLYDKLFAVLFALIAFFAFYRLGRASINNDAHFWYSRTAEFMEQIRDRDWEETLQNPKPGVTVHWLSGLSLQAVLSLYEWRYGFRPEIWTVDTFWIVHTASVGPLVAVSLGFVLVYYVVISRLFSREAAFYSVLLFGLQPFYLGLSRNYHADSTVTAFMGISALLLLLFLREVRWRWLALSGVSAGLALLSKSAAIFLLPYFGLALLVDGFFNRRAIGFYFKIALLWLFLLSLTFVALLPDMWVEPLENLRVIFVNEGLFLARVGRDGADSAGFLAGLTDYFEPLWRDLTPVMFGLSFAGLGLLLIKKKKSATEWLLLAYPLFYFLQMSLVAQKMDRYLLPLVPFLAFFGGLFLVKLEEIFSNHKKYFILVVLALNLSFVLYYFPNYLLYPSIRGKDQFGCSLCSDVGDYLNSRENSADLKIVITSNKKHRLRPFVKGKIYTLNEDLPNGWTPEYLVSAAHEEVPEGYSYCHLEKEVGFRGTPYWKIFRCKD